MRHALSVREFVDRIRVFPRRVHGRHGEYTFFMFDSRTAKPLSQQNKRYHKRTVTRSTLRIEIEPEIRSAVYFLVEKHTIKTIGRAVSEETRATEIRGKTLLKTTNNY